MTRFTEFLRGANGGLEVNRLNAFLGGVAVIVGSVGFEAWEMARGGSFDVSDFCVPLAGAVALLSGGTGIGVALKDRTVATAKIIERTGAVPTPPPAGPRVPVDNPDAEAPSAVAARKRSAK